MKRIFAGVDGNDCIHESMVPVRRAMSRPGVPMVLFHGLHGGSAVDMDCPVGVVRRGAEHDDDDGGAPYVDACISP